MEPKLSWLDDPEVFRVNKLPAHSDHSFYQCACDNLDENILAQSLNGDWRFSYSENCATRPADFYKIEYDDSSFDTITVPGHIELAGYDKLHYINTMYPWEGHYFRRPAYALDGKLHEGMFSKANYNPVGSYRLKFDLNEGLHNKRVVIRFEGVEEAMYLWCNGEFIGYSEDSFTPAEFDLSDVIKSEGNILCVEVHKRSTAAFIEDQDFFRFFGIFRNVTLFGLPKIHITDFDARPVVSEDNTGSLSVKATVSFDKTYGDKDSSNNKFVVTLQSREGDVITQGIIPFSKSEDSSLELLFPETILGKVELWDYKSPTLYRLTLQILDENNKLIEYVPYDIGFRSIEVTEEKVILLNHKRLILHGVNRHEWSPDTGRCINTDHMKQDMEIILRNNINAVRTCHYPDQTPWYFMCDKAGIYVMAETNLESHGSWQKLGSFEPSYNVPGSIPQWKEVVIDRCKNNYELLKNHPSILFWSLGNESYVGDNIAAMHSYYKGQKDGRLVHYEGTYVDREHYEDLVSDVESRMYAKPHEIADYIENNHKKPFLLCEYMHDMGASMGGMGSYMELFDKYPSYHGGFIWDFIDQALYVYDYATGEKVLAYGGDFDDRPADYEFSGNGIVFADRTEKPNMQEVKYYYGK